MSRDYAKVLERFIKSDHKIGEIVFDLDERFAELCRNYDSANFHGYDPYQFDDLLNDVNRLLDRCLVYRREYEDAVAEYARQLLEDELTLQQSSLSEQLEEAIWEEETKQVERDAFSKMGADLSGVASDPGFQAYATSQSEVAAAGVKARQTRSEIVRKRWFATRLYQGDLRELRQQPGHPLNLRHRAERILSLLVEDFEEALMKADSVADGMKLIGFDIESSFREEPKDKTVRWEPLDAFVHWARDRAVEVDQLANRESIEEIVVSLNDLKKAKPAVNQNIEFSIAKKTHRHELIDAVAFSMNVTPLKDAEGKDVDPQRLSATITLDISSNLPVRRPTRSRPNQLSFDDVGIRSAAYPPKYIAGRHLRNIPVSATMTVAISQVRRDNIVDDKLTSQISDVFVHMRIRSYSFAPISKAGASGVGTDGGSNGNRDEGEGKE